MSAARHLRVIDGNGELVEYSDPQEQIKALTAALTRQENTIKGLKADKHRERKQYARRDVIDRIFSEWQEKLGKKRCKLTDDRFDAIQNFIEKEYSEGDFSLMLDGLAEFRYVVYGKRRQHGSDDSERIDIAYVCEKGARFEELAVLGHHVRKARQA
jgi:hypothetical protein